MEMSRTIRVSTVVSNLPQIAGLTNIVSIHQHKEIQEVTEYESGMVTNLESQRSPLQTNSHIRLKPRSFNGHVLSQLLIDQEVPYGGVLGQRIAHHVKDALANDKSLRQPLFVTVNASFIRERRLRIASGDVFQRLVEEHRVETTDIFG